MSFDLVRGTSPVILAVPHAGTELPDGIAGRLNEAGRLLRDTDWHVHRLYGGLLPEATMIVAREHRYLIDLNRDPSGASLYPGQNTTGLVPLIDFDGTPIWREGEAPGADEIAERVTAYHAPYHAAVRAEIARVTALHGFAVLYDCHSIRSRIPFLFEDVLPDLNVGTNGGTSCAAGLERAVMDVLAGAAGYSHVLNGRFKGGWTTREHGRPADGVHAVQMELAQSTHLAAEAPPFAYDEDRAARLRPVLQRVLAALAQAGATEEAGRRR